MAVTKDHGRPALQLGRLLALLAALLMAGAGVTHLRVTPGHWAEDRSYGAFFLAAGVVQLGGAAALAWRSRARGWRWTLVAANLALVAIWALTRTAGVPVGVDAGARETVGVADLLAVGLELVAVALVTVELAWPGGGAGAMDRPVGRRMAAGVLLVGTLVVAPLVAAARPAPVSPLCAGHAEQAALGPLGAVDGHSVLPRGTPAARVAAGQTVRVLAGELVNRVRGRAAPGPCGLLHPAAGAGRPCPDRGRADAGDLRPDQRRGPRRVRDRLAAAVPAGGWPAGRPASRDDRHRPSRRTRPVKRSRRAVGAATRRSSGAGMAALDWR